MLRDQRRHLFLKSLKRLVWAKLTPLPSQRSLPFFPKGESPNETEGPWRVMINPLLSQALSPQPDLAGGGKECQRASDVPTATLHQQGDEGGCGEKGQAVARGSRKGTECRAGGEQLQIPGRPGEIK